jgi:2-keto-4-pentenoate hydratase/2-oxohepta-3-ene-1,7-dioic acid hydratase in catechol pathway
MLFPVARIIQILSRTWALQPGDVIYTGTPAGVGPLRSGDRVTLHSDAIGHFEWRCE